jgi:hypothetical protein
MTKSKNIQATAEKLKAIFNVDRIWYVPKADQWFTSELVARNVAVDCESKVIKY